MLAYSQVSMGKSLLRWAEMKPTERLRVLIEDAKKLGISQKTIANKIGVSESTFSRWWNREKDSKGNFAKVPVEALDMFEDLALSQFRRSPIKRTAGTPCDVPATFALASPVLFSHKLLVFA
jgi:cyanate lyase